ncbi:MAG: hypothetical protein AABW73_00210 [Nanoarchaeota archaeon]
MYLQFHGKSLEYNGSRLGLYLPNDSGAYSFVELEPQKVALTAHNRPRWKAINGARTLRDMASSQLNPSTSPVSFSLTNGRRDIIENTKGLASKMLALLEEREREHQESLRRKR